MIGEYFADIVVNELVILEIKATKALVTEHEAQLLNYLKAIPYEVGLLLNFGPKPETKRRSFDNNRKEWYGTLPRTKNESAFSAFISVLILNV